MPNSEIFYILGIAIIGVLLDWILKTYVLPKKRNLAALIASFLSLIALLFIVLFPKSNGIGSFDSIIRVENASTGNTIRNAKVTIEITNGPPIDGYTDSNGIARLTVNNSLRDSRGRLIVEAKNYIKFTQEITIAAELLPELVKLEPILEDGVENSNEVPQRNLTANEKCDIDQVIPACQILPSEVAGAFSVQMLAEILFGKGEDADIYAGLIRNLLRDSNGYIGVFRNDRWVIIPDKDEKVDFEYLNSYLHFEKCDLTRQEFPCLYTLDRTTVAENEVETYESIAAYFYGHENWASCIEDANNIVYKHAEERYEILVLSQGKTIIIPTALEKCINQ